MERRGGVKKQDSKIGMETHEDQALEETQYTIFFLPQRAWTMSRFVAFTTSCFQNITIKSKQTKMR